jgi:thermostable 8-oxoguanine DNA glycosylase
MSNGLDTTEGLEDPSHRPDYVRRQLHEDIRESVQDEMSVSSEAKVAVSKCKGSGVMEALYLFDNIGSHNRKMFDHILGHLNNIVY